MGTPAVTEQREEGTRSFSETKVTSEANISSSLQISYPDLLRIILLKYIPSGQYAVPEDALVVPLAKWKIFLAL